MILICKIDPNKIKSTRADQNPTINAFSRRSTRIVELDSDSDDNHSATDSSPSGKPIIEEPDDPPLLRRAPNSETNFDTHQHQSYPHAFFHHHAHVHPQMYAMPNVAYYHQHPAYVYAHHPHVHTHTSQQQFVHPQTHFIHQYYPMMNAHGIVVEMIDNEEANNATGNGTTSEQLYMITMNGQRYVMNEEQIRQYIAQIQQQQQQSHVHHHHQHFHQPQQYTYQQSSQENTFHNS